MYILVVRYRITGYFRSRNFRITHAKFNFEGFIFVHFQLQDNLSIRDLLSKSFIFEGVALFEIFENKIPSKITRYTVTAASDWPHLFCTLGAFV